MNATILIESQWNLNNNAAPSITLPKAILIESQWNLNAGKDSVCVTVTYINRITVEFKCEERKRDR